MDAISPLSVEVHVEDWFHALYLPEEWENFKPRVNQNMAFLLKLFARHHARATFFFLGHVAATHQEAIAGLLAEGHKVGSHGYWHRHGESEGDESDAFARQFIPSCSGYRSPYWDTTSLPGYSGGAYFRLLPYPLLHQQLQRSGVLWLHPHDLDPQHPHGKGVPLHRLIGLSTARQRLDRILTEFPIHAT